MMIFNHKTIVTISKVSFELTVRSKLWLRNMPRQVPWLSLLLVLPCTPLWAENTHRSGQLSNGFAYHFLQVPSEPGRIDVRMQVGVGASDEVDGEMGAAHMVEHMVFRDAPRYPDGVGDTLLADGWRRGANYNAMTNYERTLYMFSPPKGSEQLEMTLDALAAMVTHRDFMADDWAKEQQVIMGEWRSEQGLNERMNRKRTAVIRSGSRQARYAILGSPDSIQTMPIDALERFHQQWYVPNNMTLMVSGDFDEAQTLALIEQYFGGLQAQALPDRSGDYYEPVLQDGWHVAQLQDKESGHSQVALIFRSDDSLSRDYDSDAGSRARQIDRFASKILAQRIRNQQPALPKSVSNVSLRKADIGRHTIAVGMFASVAPDGHDEGLEELLKLRAQLLSEPVSAAEFAAYKSEYVALIERAREKTTLPEPFGDAIFTVSDDVFNNKPVQTQAQVAAQVAQLVDTITPEDVTERIERWLTADDKLVQMQAPSLTPITLPSADRVRAQALQWQNAPDLPKLMAEVVHGVGAFVDFSEDQKAQMPAVNSASAASSANVVSSRNPGIVATTEEQITIDSAIKEKEAQEQTVQEQETSITRWTLSNGDKVVVLTNPVAEDKTYLTSLTDKGFMQTHLSPWQAQLAAQIVWQSAPQGWTAEQLSDWKSSHQLSLNQDLEGQKLEVNGTVANAELENLLHLYHAYQVTPQVADDYRDAIMPLVRQIPMRNATTRSVKDNATTLLRYGRPAYLEPTQAQLEATEQPDC